MNIDRVFAALASRPRRMILAYLSQTSMTAGEIAERFEMSKPALSKHLKLLETAGLVDSEKKGQYVHYSMAEDNLPAKIHTLLTTFCPIGGKLKRESKAIAKAKSEANSKVSSATAAKPTIAAKIKTDAKPKTQVDAPVKTKPSAAVKTKSETPAKGKAAKAEASGAQIAPPGGNKLQLELAIGTLDLPLADH